MDFKNLIIKSVNWRQSKVTNLDDKAIRLFSGISDGIEGLFIDYYGQFIAITIYDIQKSKFADQILNILSELFPTHSILMKFRVEKNDQQFSFDYLGNLLYQEDAVFICHENGHPFEIHTDPKHDFGLYLDTKSAREFVQKVAINKNVLNCFAYTCAFAVAACKAPALSVTNIDPNKDYLAWGQKNAENNNVSFKKYPDTTQEYLARHLRRLESGKDKPYDLIIFDPPAFLVGRGSNRLARKLWDEWMHYLNQSKCREFLFVINDKNFVKNKNLHDFFHEGFGNHIKMKNIIQSYDVVGQQLEKEEDRFYMNPILFHLNRKNIEIY